MKNLKKTLAVVTAMAAMLSSASAFAALDLSSKDAEIDTFTCTGEDTSSPSVTVSVAAENVDGGEMTFLILNKGVSADATQINEADILYINQQTVADAGTSFTGKINLARVDGYDEEDPFTVLPVGTYPIRIGYNSKTTGEFAIAYAILEVTPDGTGGKTVTILWGDITGDTLINSEDALAALYKLAGKNLQYTVSGETAVVGGQFAGYLWGDVTGDTLINSEDALAALYRLAGKNLQYTVNGNTIAVGQSITATVD